MSSAFDAMFTSAAAPLLRQTFGVTVTLRRAGATDTTGVGAEPRHQHYEVESEVSEIHQRIAFRDYIIDVADYAFNGTAVEPRKGDTIIETINGVACTFQVLPAGDSLPVAEPEDASRQRWRIHTKQVAS